MEPVIAAVVAMIVWIVAQAEYFKSRKEGRGGFRRLAAFWLGWPVTLAVLVMVPEGRRGLRKSEAETYTELMDDIRSDRALRAGEGRDRVDEGLAGGEDEGLTVE